MQDHPSLSITSWCIAMSLAARAMFAAASDPLHLPTRELVHYIVTLSFHRFKTRNGKTKGNRGGITAKVPLRTRRTRTPVTVPSKPRRRCCLAIGITLRLWWARGPPSSRRPTIMNPRPICTPPWTLTTLRDAATAVTGGLRTIRDPLGKGSFPVLKTQPRSLGAIWPWAVAITLTTIIIIWTLKIRCVWPRTDSSSSLTIWSFLIVMRLLWIYIDLLQLVRIITFMTALEGIVPMSLASNITHR